MAKWGEGDPRWIVEDRPDAKNVNNWHWTEKDASAWSNDKLKEALRSLRFNESDIGSWTISEVKSITGEAFLSNRKGKLIILYDWTIKAHITGTTSDKNDFKATVNIPNLSDENEIDEVDIDVSLEASPLKSLKKEQFYDITINSIRKELAEYVRLLKEEFSQGIILPRKTDGSTPESSLTVVPPPSTKSPSPTPKKPSNDAVGLKIRTKKIKLIEKFMCEVGDLYDVFTVQDMVSAFTRSDSTVDGIKGGRFSMMGGQITGEFVELHRPHKLVQKWRSRSWPTEHYSTVYIELKQEEDGTNLTLVQTGIPEDDHERTKEGWKRYIFEAIKTTFGYGARLF